MNTSIKKVFFAKLLLLGEYSVIYNSKALMFPLPHFAGHWDFHNNETSSKDEVVKYRQEKVFAKLQKFLNDDEYFREGDFVFDAEGLENDLKSGLFFRSNIPESYGVGSSGALVAALFDRYFSKPNAFYQEDTDKFIPELRLLMSKIESFFHGSSSGLDPLCSFLNTPFICNSDKDIELLDKTFEKNLFEIDVFLLDTNMKGETKPLVNKFMQQVEKNEVDIQRMTYLNNLGIDTLHAKNKLEFYQTLKEISFFQWEVLDYMIPESIYPLWIEGMQTNNWYLKLCGSGGGGYILGFTTRFRWVKEYFARQGFEIFQVLG